MIRWRTPRWWYRRGPAPWFAKVLIPLSRMWADRTAVRIRRVTPSYPGAPVVCVGNLTAGGSGKTPSAMEITRLLQEIGARPFFLASGYGGSLNGPIVVDAARHAAAEVGDEALLLSRAAPVVIARDRVAGARLAVENGADVVVMDDGHQNPSLAKALSIVVVDGETRNGEWPFGGGGVIPAGPMREPLATGLARADVVVVVLPADVDEPDPDLVAILAEKRLWIARWTPTTNHRHPARNAAQRSVDAGPSRASPDRAQLGPGSSLAALPPSGMTVSGGGSKVLAFAGIAKPWRVEHALRAAGFDLVGFEAFPDHAPISEAALRRLATRAEKAGALLITTEKDWVRLSPEWRERVTAWPVRIVFDDEATVSAALRAAWRG